MFPGPLGESLAGKALTEGVWSLEAVDIRRFAKDRHGTVDDAPFGGGAGMVMKPDVLSAAIEAYGKSGNKWIGIPGATTGGLMNYRISAMEKAGFKEFPKDTGGFLELVKALKKNNTPAGLALGHASGGANTSLHWALWAE